MFQIKEYYRETWQLNAESHLRLGPTQQNNATKDIMKTADQTVESSTVKSTDVDNCSVAAGYARERPRA